MHSESSSESAEVCLCTGGRLHEWELDNVALFPLAAAQLLHYVTSTGYKRTTGGSASVYVNEEFLQ